MQKYHKIEKNTKVSYLEYMFSENTQACIKQCKILVSLIIANHF